MRKHALTKIASKPPKTSSEKSTQQVEFRIGSELVPEWFRLATLPGQVFRPTRMFDDHLEAYGGDRQLCGRRQFRSFPLDTKFLPTKAPDFANRSEGLRGCIQ